MPALLGVRGVDASRGVRGVDASRRVRGGDASRGVRGGRGENHHTHFSVPDFDFTVCDFTTFCIYWSGESLKIVCTESWRCEEEGSCKTRAIEGVKGGFGGEEAKVQIVGKVWEMQKWAFNPLTRPSGSCILACVATRLGGSAPNPPRKKSSKTVNDFPRSCVYGG